MVTVLIRKRQLSVNAIVPKVSFAGDTMVIALRC